MAIILDRLSSAISNNFLTAATANSITKGFIVADDNLVSYKGTNYSNQKELRFVRNSVDLKSNTMIIKSETMSTNGTTDIGFFFDNEISPRKILSTIGTGFELLEGTAYIGDLSDGVHLLNINLRNLNNGTSYQRLIELYEKI